MSSQNSAKFAFLYLLSLAALIFISLSLGMILFEIIDRFVPDILSNRISSDNALKFAISALIIASPVFYLSSRFIFLGIKKGELSPDAPLRRWLTYFILLLASITILGVLIGIINNFLSGELTWRFVLKALAMLIIASLVFSFYLLSLRKRSEKKEKFFLRIYFWASLLFIIIVFISAWFYVESPAEARQRKIDSALVSKMYNLEGAINTYFESQGELPESLEQLAGYLPQFDQNHFSGVIDYNRLGNESFELCATFLLDNKLDQAGYAKPFSSDYNYHSAGYNCLPGNLWSARQIAI